MKNYITFTRKNLLALFLLTICIIVILNQLYPATNNEKNALTNADRLNFLKTAGYTVLCDTPTVKCVTLPEKFSNTYSNYNELQLSAGYDLSLYKGSEATIYSYMVKAPNGYSGEAYVTLIVYCDRIIGGDVSSKVFAEYMLPLRMCE